MSAHWTQFLTDSGLLDVAMMAFFIQYKGKCIVDATFGATMVLLMMMELVVGVDDFARMIQTLPQGNSNKHAAFIINPAALSELGLMFKGRYYDLVGLSKCNFHWLTACSRLDRIADLPLGLVGRFADLTLHGLLKEFIATEPVPGSATGEVQLSGHTTADHVLLRTRSRM